MSASKEQRAVVCSGGLAVEVLEKWGRRSWHSTAVGHDWVSLLASSLAFVEHEAVVHCNDRNSLVKSSADRCVGSRKDRGWLLSRADRRFEESEK